MFLPGGGAFPVDAFGGEAPITLFISDLEVYEVDREGIKGVAQRAEYVEVADAFDDAR